MKKIIVTAANGFLGKSAIKFLKKEYQVVALVRGKVEEVPGVKYLQWDGRTLGSWQSEFEGAKAVLNFAGRSVDCRYTEENKAQILRSRIESTEIIGQAIDLCIDKPEVWMNAASGTIYAHSENQPMTEEKGVEGKGFSVEICQAWERAFFDYTYTNVRQVALRTTIVLGNGGGAFPIMRRLMKFALGGKQGNGRQKFSWIHVHDFVRALVFILENDTLSGSINVASPTTESNASFMRKLRQTYKRKVGITQPKWLLEIGAMLIRTETELILKSRYVMPEILMNSGFTFEYSTVEEALVELKREE